MMVRMNVESFGSIKVFRPRRDSEMEIRREVGNYLLGRFSPGRYEQRDKINEILQHLFGFYSKKADKLLPKIATQHILDFVLFQYDLATEIQHLFDNGGLEQGERSRWEVIGASSRRAMKYIVERIVSSYSGKPKSRTQERQLSILEQVWICVEEMVNLYISSDTTYRVFPNDSFIEIFPSGGEKIFQYGINKPLGFFFKRVSNDKRYRSRFIEKEIIFDVDWQDQFMGGPFQGHFGITYRGAMKCLLNIIEHSQPASGGAPTLFIAIDQIVMKLSETLSVQPEVVRLVLKGFSVSQDNERTLNHEIYRVNREYRPLRRGFFEFPHSTGLHIAFSMEMAKECLMMLMMGVVFQQFPIEWRCEEINRSLGTLASEAGAWFEQIVYDNFRKLGFRGSRSMADGIGEGDRRLAIPPMVGEIDYIGYSERDNLLVVAECKMIQGNIESRSFEDDISKFINGDDAYTRKLERKHQWVLDNIEAVCSALELSKRPIFSAGLFVTYFPTIASDFVDSYDCISLTELMLSYEQKGEWCYRRNLIP